jgi:hypothetical protein
MGTGQPEWKTLPNERLVGILAPLETHSLDVR